MIEVHEVHDWPERAVPGPRIVVWSGRNRTEAEATLKRLTDRHRDSRFRYEMVERESPPRGQSGGRAGHQTGRK